MAHVARQTPDEHLAREYPFHVIASRDGGYVVVYPDLPGCITQADSLDEIPEMADEARRLWIEAEYEDGHDIPPPSYPEEYSGKFVARLPRSLHRQLAEEADRQGVSLNQHVVTLLSRGDSQIRLERRLTELEGRITFRFDHLSEQMERLRFPITEMPFATDQRVRVLAGRAGPRGSQQRYQVRKEAQAV